MKQKALKTKQNSQLPLQHVHNEPVNPTSTDQVPGHASEVSCGTQRIIFAMLFQVLVSGHVYLHKTHRITPDLCDLAGLYFISNNKEYFKKRENFTA